MASLEVDLSEFAALSASLGRASAVMVTAERAAVAQSLARIKKATRKGISTNPTWAKLSQTVTFDIVGLSGEVGYEDRGQGELAGIAEFGSARHAPHPALMPAARDEAPLFEKATASIAAGVLEAALTGAPMRIDYVTKDGRTIRATEAQIANFTRGSR